MKTQKLLFWLLITSVTINLSAQSLAVYVSDAANFSSGPWNISKFDENGNFVGQLINVDDGIVWPQDIIFLDNEEAVLISNLSSLGTISKHNWSTGEFIENFAEGLGGPTRMKIGPDGLFYVIQWSQTNNKVLRFELDGTPLGEFTQIGIRQSIGIDWDANGDLYISSYGDSKIQKFNGVTGDDLGVWNDSDLQGPTNIWFEDDGNLIALNYDSGIIRRFDPSGNAVADLVTGVQGCEGFDFFPNGDILIGVGSDGSIRRYDSNFNFIENFHEPDPDILITPNAIVIRPDVPLSVGEIKVDSTFIVPTIGTRFRLIKNDNIFTKTFRVYNTQGLLIQSTNLESDLVWDAQGYSEGMYFIVGATTDGQKFTQKVLVKK